MDNIGKFIRELRRVATSVNITLNADFDGDVLNTLALPLEGVWEMLEGFSPINMLINRTDECIRYDVSANENVTLAMFSDR